MLEGKRDRIARLLREGLDHYGEGRSTDAARAWNEVLFLDPAHAEARDYLATLGSEARPAPRLAAAPAAARAGGGDLAEDALRMMREGNLEAALELLEAASRRDTSRMDLQGYLEMLKSRLHERYRERVGGLTSVPKLHMRPDEVLRFNLPATAGFLLSLVDGQTSVEDLVSLSGLDAFEALRVLAGLLDAGIIRSAA